MSCQHPIVAVTGSSGSGSPVVTTVITQVLQRLGSRFAIIDGDGFHRYGRREFIDVLKREMAQGKYLSHFSPETNHLDKLESLFKEFSKSGRGLHRRYLHEASEARENGRAAGSFTPWIELPEDTDLIVYEGLHGCFTSATLNIAHYVDLKIGVAPIVNLEWIQKIHRDTRLRGYSQEAVADTILRRMSDYVRYITPQFSATDVNFQRIPMVDTSNPFDEQPLPTLDESKLVVHFRDLKKMPFTFPDLLRKIPDSFVSRRNHLVIPGSEFELALQLVLEAMIARLLDRCL